LKGGDILGEVIEIGVSQEVVGFFLEFEDPIEGVEKILDDCPWLKEKEFSYLTSTGERRFTVEGAIEVVVKSEQPNGRRVRKIYSKYLANRIGEKEVIEEMDKIISN
jgi:hypothetical protein